MKRQTILTTLGKPRPLWRLTMHYHRIDASSVLYRRLYSFSATAAASHEKGVRLLVSNVPWDVDTEEFTQFLKKQTQSLKHAEICFHQTQSLGYGMAEFQTEEDAHQALETLQNKELAGRQVLVTKDTEVHKHSGVNDIPAGSIHQTAQQNKGVPSKHVTSYVKIDKVAAATTWRDLKHIFKDHAPKFAEFFQDGSALISLFGVEQAKHAVTALRNTEYKGVKLHLREVPRDSLGRPMVEKKKQKKERHASPKPKQ